MTGLPWLRLYTEYATDPKIQILAFDDQRHFVMLLCLKGNGTLDCVLPNENYRERMIAKALGLDAGTAAEVKRRLVEGGLINEQWGPLAWDERQMKSDHNAHERTERYRANREANGLPRVSKVNERFWDQIFQRDGGKCVYCDSTAQLLLDHMVPIKHGGTDDTDNLALACKRCNCGKAGRTPELAGYEIADPARLALERYRGRHAGDTERHAIDKKRLDKTRLDKTKSLAGGAPPPWFEEFKQVYPKRAGDQQWRKAISAGNARITEGHQPTEFIAGAARYAVFLTATGKTGTEYVQQAARFLGPGKPFLLPWNPPAIAESATDEIKRLNSGGAHAPAGRVFEAEPSRTGLVPLFGNVRR